MTDFEHEAYKSCYWSERHISNQEAYQESLCLSLCSCLRRFLLPGMRFLNSFLCLINLMHLSPTLSLREHGLEEGTQPSLRHKQVEYER